MSLRHEKNGNPPVDDGVDITVDEGWAVNAVLAERLKAPVLKTGDPTGSAGSNPAGSGRSNDLCFMRTSS